jgi:ankyrin repeat protein
MDIFQAIERGNLPRVRELISNNVDVNTYKDGLTPLMNAVINGDKYIVSELLQVPNINVNALALGTNRYSRGSPAIVLSMQMRSTRHREIVDLLLRHPTINVNLRNDHGTTVLMFAAGSDNLETVQKLIASNADVNLVDNNNKKAVDYTRNLEIINYLASLPVVVSPQPVRPPRQLEVIPLNEQNNLFANRLQCNVCMEHAVNTRLNPCGHLVCSMCYTSLPEPKKCPTCRQQPVTDEPIFYGGYYNKLQKYIHKNN